MKTTRPTILSLLLFTFACIPLQTFLLQEAYTNHYVDASPADTTTTNVTANIDARGRKAKLLSAFFGLDNGLPPISGGVICEGAGGKDGMPVVFSHEIDFRTMQAGDFRVTTASGQIGTITCVTLAPADDTGELRTVLLVGEYGSAEDEPA